MLDWKSKLLLIEVFLKKKKLCIMSEFWASAFTYYFPFILKKNIFKYKIFYVENIFCETFSL